MKNLRYCIIIVLASLLLGHEAAAGVWANPPPPYSADELFRITHRHALSQGFPTAFRTWYCASSKCGVFFINPQAVAEAKDVPREVLTHDFSNVPEMYRAADNYQSSQGGLGAAIPAFEQGDHGQGVVYWTIFLKHSAYEWRDVPKSELGWAEISDYESMFRAADLYAWHHGFSGAFPTFHQAGEGNDIVYGLVLLKPGMTEWQDVPEEVLEPPRPCTKVAGTAWVNRRRWDPYGGFTCKPEPVVFTYCTEYGFTVEHECFP
jgi:hypothetical protein